MSAPLLIDGRPLVLRPAEIGEIIDLRWHVLRQGLARETAIFPGDDAPDTRYFAAVFDERVVGCASLVHNAFDDQDAWQLRGMATADAWRGRAVGSSLLTYAIDALSAEFRPSLLWCNARVPAMRFYQKQAWRVVSDVFEIPTAGPHVKMIRPLTPAS
jgi:predicted GNAT family N-acyltransferase